MRVVEADIGHLWQHLEAKRCATSAHEYGLLVGEVLARRAYAGLVGEHPVALGGVLDAADGGPGYAWLSVLPGSLEKRLVVAVRHIRRTMAAVAASHPAGIACAVDDDNGAGQRLALALRFNPGHGAIGMLRSWHWHG
ncbi:MAG: hypothetical protein AB7O57_04275 [Hyphomicrobiaceae bacterium]